ncbi:hypothetical protein HUT19_22890 [Streptomyces sp. NA02950]|uniref:hypothetical protein n=1 Tax=Streptomyces sp. NA02950 TaxID=2742137 RepID=UPI001590FB5F|nr:hypothetical protein [Streptomyces sp. NA02950]QKV94251.1 hypothetical protein HUT19_22890 [Streptomyces sp. NA02950]
MNLQHQAGNFVNASWSLLGLRDLIYEMVDQLFVDLEKNGGMAGDDDAGRAFAAVYTPAVKMVFEKAGSAHQVMATGAGTLLLAAEQFLRQDSKVAASLLDQSPGAADFGSQPSGPDCTPRSSHNAEDLPDVVGETSWSQKWLHHQRFRGQRDKLRKVAKSWRSAAKILEDAYWDSDTAWKTATLDQAGETADAAHSFFKTFVGKTAPPSVVGEDETLMANLPSACKMLASACDAYADHIDTALEQIPWDENEPFRGPELSPGLGGNGTDGGLHELVASDTHIAALGKIPRALDSSRARVPVPQPDGDSLPGLPIPLAPLIRVPALVPAGYRVPTGPRIPPNPTPGTTGSPFSPPQPWPAAEIPHLAELLACG